MSNGTRAEEHEHGMSSLKRQMCFMEEKLVTGNICTKGMEKISCTLDTICSDRNATIEKLACETSWSPADLSQA